jgi:hypothetical protein
MNKKLMITLSVVLAAVGVSTAIVLPSAAQEPPPPIAVELLTPRSTFTDDVDLRVRYKLEGTQRPSRNVLHTHPGPVIVNVAEGELVYVQAGDCVERSYPMGTAFVDPGRGNVHTAFNPTDGETVLIATFFEVPETGPLTITEGVVPGDC